jgi:hypothetical protein
MSKQQNRYNDEFKSMIVELHGPRKNSSGTDERLWFK